MLLVFALISAALTMPLTAIAREIYEGNATYYYEWRGNFGSCGLERSKSEQFEVAALSNAFMKLPQGVYNPNKHPLCRPEHCIFVTGALGSVVLKISDKCYGCRKQDIDIADSVFPLLGDLDKGRIPIKWYFVNCKDFKLGPSRG